VIVLANEPGGRTVAVFIVADEGGRVFSAEQPQWAEVFNAEARRNHCQVNPWRWAIGEIEQWAAYRDLTVTVIGDMPDWSSAHDPLQPESAS
jgi:hypothetical protein